MSNASESVDDKTTSDLKAGHAPAMKVGGMRVPAPRRTSHSDDKKTSTEDHNDAANSDNNSAAGNAEGGQETTGQSGADVDEEASHAVSRHQPAGQLVGGQFVRIQDAFPTEAVRHTHEKHFDNVPKNEPHTRTSHHEAKFVIQPRKM